MAARDGSGGSRLPCHSLSPEVVREVFDHTRALPCPEAVASCEPHRRMVIEEAGLAILLCVLLWVDAL